MILFAFLFGGCLESCAAPNGTDIGTNTATEKVTFTLPEYGKIYPALDHWEISISGCSEVSEYADGKKYKIPPSKNSFTLTLPKNKIIALTARPVTKNSNGEQTLFFYPAGTVYPSLASWDGHKAQNTFTWEDGFTAKLIEVIYSSSKSAGYSQDEVTDFVERFNWKKFSETIYSKEEKSDTHFYNPWQIDMGVLIQKLLSKNFSVTAMNPKGVIALPVENITLPACPERKTNENPACSDGQENPACPDGNTNCTDGKPLLFSPYIPENDFIAASGTLTVTKNTANRFLYNTDYVLLITASSEKKVSTETVFLPKIVREEE